MSSCPSPTARYGHAETGFTMIEVIVAATLLIVGVLASLMLLDTGAKSTASSLQRDTANAVAQEVIERATGMPYTTTRNDLTDVRGTNAAPADRLRAAMDPDGDQQSTKTGTNAWKLRRGNTDYTVTYQACTSSDAAQGITIAGPYDCQRAETDDPTDPSTTQGQCKITLTNASSITHDAAGQVRTPAQIAELLNAGTLTIRLQLLNLVALDACLPSLLPSSLAKGLCAVLGTGTSSILRNVTGLVNSVLGPLSSGLGLGLCPEEDVRQNLPDLSAGIGSSTTVKTIVSWSERGSDRQPTIVQRAVVRRPAP